jgi:N-acyl-D-amino-acid deacylase
MSEKISRRTFFKSSAIAGAALGLGFYDSRKLNIENPFETIISGGTIYVGDGKEPIVGDVGIKNGKIAAIGRLGTAADHLIDASGLAVSPGFIDIHSHTDTNLLIAPKGDSRIFQGITTEAGGNCGDSPFPYSEKYYSSKKGTLRHGYPFWQDIDGFYDALEKNRIGINYCSYTGQGELRSAVVGNNAVSATKGELKKMCAILSDEMDKGSIGMSCGLEYAPGSYASDEEITELCKVVASKNGTFAIHLRNEDDNVEKAVAEAIAIAKKSGVRLQISHLKAQNANNWHKAPALIKQIEEAQKEGLDIAFDRYPYIAFSTGLTSFIPLSERQGSDAEVIARLENKGFSDKIGEYARSRIQRLGGAKNVVVVNFELPENEKFTGKNLEECSDMTGLDPWVFIRKILIEERLGPDIIGFAMNEDNVKLFLSHPLGMPTSDGSVYAPYGPLGEMTPHPRSYGTFPRFLGKYVREEKIIDLPTAIYKCTALPASRIGLRERGLLIPGYAADVTVFHPDTIIDTATFIDPHKFPIGIRHVFVNGQWTIRDGEHTGKLAGIVWRP